MTSRFGNGLFWEAMLISGSVINTFHKAIHEFPFCPTGIQLVSMLIETSPSKTRHLGSMSQKNVPSNMGADS